MYAPKLLTEVNGIMRSDAEDSTDEFAEEIGKMSGRCIDIGTGAGDVTVDFILPKLGPDSTLLCSDFSEEMVKYGKEHYGNDKRLSFMQLDIESPELPEDLVGQFDNLTSLNCLHWCYDLRRAIENMYSLLRPGGTAFLTFVASLHAFDAFAVLKAIPKYEIYLKEAGRIVPPFQQVERPRRLLMTLLSDIGFQVQTCTYRAMSYNFDTPDELKNLFLAGSPFDVQLMSPDLRNEYARDLVREITKRVIVYYKDENKKDEYSSLLRYRSLVVYLKKPLNG